MKNKTDRNLKREKGRINYLPFSLSSFLPLFFLLVLTATLSGCSSCRQSFFGKKEVKPRSLRDVPAQRLSYRFEPDVQKPQDLTSIGRDDKVQSVENDFKTNRTVDGLHASLLSPDGQKVLAVYISPDSSEGEYQIDLYGVNGALIRNITNPMMAVVAPETVAWSPDGSHFAFIAKQSKNAPQTPADTEPADKPAEHTPDETAPSPMPIVPITPAFPNEQIYTCKGDGFNLKPLVITKMDLVYFYFAWSPDSTQLVALASRRDEFDSRPADLALAGRPRLINLQGVERLLDDKLTDVFPVWSPDASKIAAAFGTDVKIYDAGTDTPSQAVASLRAPLITASRAYDDAERAKSQGNNPNAPQSQTPVNPNEEPISFNPIVRLFWQEPKTLYLETGFVRLSPDETVNNFMRWHRLNLSPQSAILD